MNTKIVIAIVTIAFAASMVIAPSVGTVFAENKQTGEIGCSGSTCVIQTSFCPNHSICENHIAISP